MKRRALQVLANCEPWAHAVRLQQETVRLFHETCAAAVAGGCPLRPLDDRLLDIRRNLFSTLFIMAAEAAGVSRERLPLYAFVFQCLRAQVTGCDNLLDDEFKEVIPFDLPGDGIRFRSVLTIMTADAALSLRLTSAIAAGELTPEEGKSLVSGVLAVLIPSGVEEHEEEFLVDTTPPTVEEMVSGVHYRKTGLLFEAPIRLAQRMGHVDDDRADQVAGALSRFGVACQILDDLKDVADDLYLKKYNVVVSEAWHSARTTERRAVRHCLGMTTPDVAAARCAARHLTLARVACRNRAVALFMEARKLMSACLPAFGMKEATALGLLVQQAILKDRNDILLREPL